MGVRVTLRRIGSNEEPVTRTFDGANDWKFARDENFHVLRVAKQENGVRKDIAQFPANAVESVEFV